MFYKKMQHVENSCSACQQKPISRISSTFFTQMFAHRSCTAMYLTAACYFSAIAYTSAWPCSLDRSEVTLLE